VERLQPAAVFVAEGLKAFIGMFHMMWTIAQRAVERAPSIAYEPPLIEKGGKPVFGQALASLKISLRIEGRHTIGDRGHVPIGERDQTPRCDRYLLAGGSLPEDLSIQRPGLHVEPPVVA